MIKNSENCASILPIKNRKFYCLVNTEKGGKKPFTLSRGITTLRLQNALREITNIETFNTLDIDKGFGAIALNRRPGVKQPTQNDLSGRYWLRADERYVEEAR